MAELKVKPSNDVLAKILLLEDTEALKSLIAAALKCESTAIGEIEVLNNELVPDIPEGKLCRLDLSAKVDERLVEIEIQVASEEAYADRALYYWSMLHSNALRKGQGYRKLMATIQINIVCFPMFEAPSFASRFKVLECSRHEVFSDNLEILVFETTKLPEVIDTHDKMQLWLKLFAATTDKDLDDLEQMGDAQMAQTAVRVRELSEDERIAETERMRKKAEVDEVYRMIAAEKRGMARGEARGEARGMAKGRAEGRAEGEARGMTKLVAFMASQGHNTSEIAALTGLAEAEVLRLLSS